LYTLRFLNDFEFRLVCTHCTREPIMYYNIISCYKYVYQSRLPRSLSYTRVDIDEVNTWRRDTNIYPGPTGVGNASKIRDPRGVAAGLARGTGGRARDALTIDPPAAAAAAAATAAANAGIYYTYIYIRIRVWKSFPREIFTERKRERERERKK